MKTYAELTDEMVVAIQAMDTNKLGMAELIDAGLLVVRSDRRLFLKEADRQRIIDEIGDWNAEYSPGVQELSKHIIGQIWYNRDQDAETRALFVDDAVQAPSVAAFLARYYKPDRYTGRNKTTGWDDSYAAELLAHYEADFERKGWIIISHHDNVTGKVVALLELTPDKEAP